MGLSSCLCYICIQVHEKSRHVPGNSHARALSVPHSVTQQNLCSHLYPPG